MKKGITLFLMLFIGISGVFGQTESKEKSVWEQEIGKRDPGKPINFGYKCVWAAVKTTETEKLLNVLNLEKLEKANWADGLAKGNNGYVFVFPPIEGWILIYGWGLPAPDAPNGIKASNKLLNQLSKSFGEAQLFGNHPVSSAAFWMKSVNGVVERLYCIADGTSFIGGNPTPVEAPWALLDTNSKEADSAAYWDSMVYPDAEHVLEVAESWSLNPMNLEKYKGVGEFGHTGMLRKE